MDQIPKCNSPNYKTTRRKQWKTASWHWMCQWFLDYDTKCIGSKINNRQKRLHQTSKLLLCIKGHNEVKRQSMKGRKYLHIIYLTRA